MWRRVLRTGTRVAINIAALLFVMLVVFAIMLFATGKVDRAKLSATVSLVQDESEAVENATLAELRQAKERLERQERIAPEEREARAVVERADEMKKQRLGELVRGEEVLDFLLAEIERRQAGIDARIKGWEVARREFDAQRLAEQEDRKAAALTRVRKIITTLEPAMIAESYQQKYTGIGGVGVVGDPKKLEQARQEVIDDFLMLREPFVGEILAAFTGAAAPRLRMEILERLKRAGMRDKLAARGESAIPGAPGAP